MHLEPQLTFSFKIKNLKHKTHYKEKHCSVQQTFCLSAAHSLMVPAVNKGSFRFLPDQWLPDMRISTLWL